jgi:hypothetical protein
LVRVKLAGETRELEIDVDAPRAPDLAALLSGLDDIRVRALQHPRMTLRLGLAMDASPWPPGPRTGAEHVQVTLRFHNDGPTGYWMTEPASFVAGASASARDGSEHCGVLYVVRKPTTPGITPSPSEPTFVHLDPEAKIDDPVVWLAGHAVVHRRFVAALRPYTNAAGAILARATWSSYAGEDSLEDKPRLRGCVFSNELSLAGDA